MSAVVWLWMIRHNSKTPQSKMSVAAWQWMIPNSASFFLQFEEALCYNYGKYAWHDTKSN